MCLSLPTCSAGCNVLRQWDLARAVPRHVRDVPLVKGDILGIATRPGSVYTCGADGSIRCAGGCRFFACAGCWQHCVEHQMQGLLVFLGLCWPLAVLKSSNL